MGPVVLGQADGSSRQLRHNAGGAGRQRHQAVGEAVVGRGDGDRKGSQAGQHVVGRIDVEAHGVLPGCLHAHPSVNGSRVAPDSSTHTALVSVKSLIASMPFSRPMPLCPMPPNGTWGATTRYALTHTVPARSLAATRWARWTSLVHTAPARPNSVAFAAATASSSSRKVITVSTAPKISSATARIDGFTPVSTVGLTK